MNYKAAAQAIHKERVQLWIALGKPWSEDRNLAWKTRQPGFIRTRSGQIIEALIFPKTGWTDFHHEEHLLRYEMQVLKMMMSGRRTCITIPPGTHKVAGLFTQFTEQWNAHSQN